MSKTEDVKRESGAVVSDEFPKLSGTPKQLAWAHKIRDEIAIIDPENKALQRETEAKY